MERAEEAVVRLCCDLVVCVVYGMVAVRDSERVGIIPCSFAALHVYMYTSKPSDSMSTYPR